MISAIFSLYNWRYPRVLVYMLQTTEYQTGPYLAWYWRTQNFSRVMHRRVLEQTARSRLLLIVLRAGMLGQLFAGVLLIYLWKFYGLVAGWQFGLAVILAYPVFWAHIVVVPLAFGRILIVKPKERRRIKQSEAIFKKHKGIKIAVVGSYGKTSMKELLVTVLGEGKEVAATPANKNVAISHARFAATLTGNEDILVIEYGEGAPGDIERFARTTHPSHAVITGVAPVHLNKYKTVQAAGHDIFAAARYLRGKHVYVNAESPGAEKFMKSKYHAYSTAGALGWKVKQIKLAISGTSFELTKGKRKLKLHSGLVGKHQVGPLALSAALALELGLSEAQVQAGIAKTLPFEHRMQPYQLAGAWIIDDTYNGNIEGIRAGTALLAALPAKRRLYVTPGLVDQGGETEAVHRTIGELIAGSKADVVVIMKNSVTKYIQSGLDTGGYKGEVVIEADPLQFYTNLDQFVATGDLVLMQNDWTDNYK